MKRKEWAKVKEITDFLSNWLKRYYLLDCTKKGRKKVVLENEKAFKDIVWAISLQPIFNSDKTLCYVKWYVKVEDESVLDDNFDPKSIDREQRFGDIEKNDILRTMHIK